MLTKSKLARNLGPLASLGLAFSTALVTMAAEAKPSKPIQVSDKMSIQATVEAIDRTNRTVTLKGPKGNLLTISVDEGVSRFDQLKVGDSIQAKYYESVVVEVNKSSPVPPGDARMTASAPLPGVKPGGVRTSQTTTVVTIEAIDPETPAVTVRTSDGSVVSLRIKNKKYLKDVKVGDQVTITKTQGLIVEVGD
ncbi:MAG TPA: hypothetical protein VKJ00_05085 [Thermoanaerobaculia bacterium]|nr:hypothetical protein [Thermoanaerobaculia bacterium]